MEEDDLLRSLRDKRDSIIGSPFNKARYRDGLIPLATSILEDDTSVPAILVEALVIIGSYGKEGMCTASSLGLLIPHLFHSDVTVVEAAVRAVKILVVSLGCGAVFAKHDAAIQRVLQLLSETGRSKERPCSESGSSLAVTDQVAELCAVLATQTDFPSLLFAHSSPACLKGAFLSGRNRAKVAIVRLFAWLSDNVNAGALLEPLLEDAEFVDTLKGLGRGQRADVVYSIAECLAALSRFDATLLPDALELLMQLMAMPNIGNSARPIELLRRTVQALPPSYSLNLSPEALTAVFSRLSLACCGEESASGASKAAALFAVAALLRRSKNLRLGLFESGDLLTTIVQTFKATPSSSTISAAACACIHSLSVFSREDSVLRSWLLSAAPLLLEHIREYGQIEVSAEGVERRRPAGKDGNSDPCGHATAAIANLLQTSTAVRRTVLTDKRVLETLCKNALGQDGKTPSYTRLSSYWALSNLASYSGRREIYSALSEHGDVVELLTSEHELPLSLRAHCLLRNLLADNSVIAAVHMAHDLDEALVVHLQSVLTGSHKERKTGSVIVPAQKGKSIMMDCFERPEYGYDEEEQIGGVVLEAVYSLCNLCAAESDEYLQAIFLRDELVSAVLSLLGEGTKDEQLAAARVICNTVLRDDASPSHMDILREKGAFLVLGKIATDEAGLFDVELRGVAECVLANL